MATVKRNHNHNQTDKRDYKPCPVFVRVITNDDTEKEVNSFRAEFHVAAERKKVLRTISWAAHHNCLVEITPEM